MVFCYRNTHSLRHLPKKVNRGMASGDTDFLWWPFSVRNVKKPFPIMLLSPLIIMLLFK